MNLILKGRLKLLADKVPNCDVIADIGTDHAYLPIYLIQQGVCKRAIASDVRLGPVNAANNNINIYKMKDKIETRLGSGLDTIAENEAEVIIIAGMGGTLLIELLEANEQKAHKAASLILQPMIDIDVVRKWLYDHKFDIYDEELIAEGAKIYCVLSAKYNGGDKGYQNFQLHVGEKLIKKHDPLLLLYCEMKVRQIDRVLRQLEAMEDNSQLRGNYSSLKKDYTDLIKEL
ncbi:MAG: tRNA (adenine(22)-N(1))-methyltransferase [Ruminiclostridium sp.]